MAQAERSAIPRWMIHGALIMLCLMAIAPFLWLLSTSLKTDDNVMRSPPQIIPDPLALGNYHDVVLGRDATQGGTSSSTSHFLLWTRNTLVVTGLTVLGVTCSSAIVAYGFARIRFRGRGFLFALMLATMMIPFPVTMVSLFSIFRWLTDHTGIRFIGTFRPLWVPAWFGSAYSIFLLRQFFLTIPEELSEAARIDGCSEIGIFAKIILPLCRPALIVVALFSFMAAWNDFTGPYIYIKKPEQFTLALGLQSFQSQLGGSQWNLLMAAAVLVIVPVLLLFFVAQKAFITGIATTGIKG
jgi:multiple sugar transport system permease protein